MTKPKLGSGERFAKLKSSLESRMKGHAKGKPHDAGALAAYIGRKRYGNAKMAKMSAAGRK